LEYPCTNFCMRRILFFLLLVVSMKSHAQLTQPFNALHAMPKAELRKNMGTDTSNYLSVYNKNGINYLLPFYKAFYYEKQLGKDTISYFQDLSQLLAFVGDTKSIKEIKKITDQKLIDGSVDEAKKLVDSLKGVVYEDARQYILSKTRNNRVVMINEAHDNPLHRAFTTSLLEDMYNQGFRYLAMEMLNNRSRRAITKVDMNAGYYVCEPMAGELVRKALELGYTLVPYEDTVFPHTVKQREYAQAENIAAVIKKDPAAKILVHAGYGHIEEAALSDDFIPMAAYFKIISGIDPLTVSQTNMTEGGNTPFEAEVYKQWIRKHPINISTVALLDNKPIDIGGSLLNDIYVIHPPAKYANERPTWMGLTGKKEIPVTPAFKSVFLVQAYFMKEYNEKTASAVIPADQTYNDAANGLYHLYLRKGIYKIIFRDKNYALLGSKDIEVN
jgi:hypothetical protein